MDSPQLMRVNQADLPYEIYYHPSPRKHSLIHSTLNAFYFPYRLGNQDRIANNLHQELITTFGGSYDIRDFARSIGRVIYVSDENLLDISQYNGESGVGCIWLFKMSEDYYCLLGIMENNGLSTVFGMNSDLIRWLHKKIIL